MSNTIESRIKNEYLAFLKKPIPDLSRMYGADHEKVVVRFFYLASQMTMLTQSSRRNSAPEFEYFSFPIAKVLFAGDGAKYKKGDILRLKDWDAKTVVNPHRAVWDRNDMDKSNAIKIGTEPVRIFSNVHKKFVNNIFNVNPLNLSFDHDDNFTFVLHGNDFFFPITDPYAFLDDFRTVNEVNDALKLEEAKEVNSVSDDV
jgi:hypothetical protein